MNRRVLRALTLLTVAAVLVVAPVVTAWAQEEGADDGAAEATQTYEPGTEPAVVLSDGGAEEDDPAWTFRYLVPTLLVASAIALLGLAVWYGLGVKGRYRVAR